MIAEARSRSTALGLYLWLVVVTGVRRGELCGLQLRDMEAAMEKVVDRPRHAFIPFSIGKRQCMAQEVTFMMLRVVLFEVYRRYRLRLAPGATVVKNAVVTTKPAAVPVIRVPREVTRPRVAAALMLLSEPGGAAHPPASWRPRCHARCRRGARARAGRSRTPAP